MEEAGFILSDVDRAPNEASFTRELVVPLASSVGKQVGSHVAKKLVEGQAPCVVRSALYVQIWTKRGTQTVFEPGEAVSFNRMPLPKRYGLAVIDQAGRITIKQPTGANLKGLIEPGSATGSASPEHPSEAERLLVEVDGVPVLMPTGSGA
jgi:hypothetical protein